MRGHLSVRFEPLTEVAERAFFNVETGRATEVVACIKQRVPQGDVDPLLTVRVRPLRKLR